MIPSHCGFTLAEVEQEYILDTLVCCHGNRMRAAKLLNISVRSLRMKLHDYAQLGCTVCESDAQSDQPLCERAKSPLAPCRRH
jgi:Bacterial regulatory protein, Fis family